MKKTMKRKITEKEINNYIRNLGEKERSKATIEKYRRDIKKFQRYLGEEEVVQKNIIDWKNELLEYGYKISSINSMLAAINSFLDFLDWKDCKVKLLCVQKENFVKPELELSIGEYEKLLRTAKNEGKDRICIIMQTICSTGIRISELPFITVIAVKKGCTQIHLKGKIRTVFLPDCLRKILLLYIKKNGIAEGSVFVTKGNLPVNRSNIWREMKSLCKKAGIEESKVFPHNLRHLFARTHYTKYHDIIRLSDIMGHSSVDTTRIYMMESGKTHIWQINQLKLVSDLKQTTT